MGSTEMVFVKCPSLQTLTFILRRGAGPGSFVASGVLQRLRNASLATQSSSCMWLWVNGTQETPGEHQNRWYMGVHPPQNGGTGYDPWPCHWLIVW